MVNEKTKNVIEQINADFNDAVTAQPPENEEEKPNRIYINIGDTSNTQIVQLVCTVKDYSIFTDGFVLDGESGGTIEDISYKASDPEDLIGYLMSVKFAVQDEKY